MFRASGDTLEWEDPERGESASVLLGIDRVLQACGQTLLNEA